MDGGMMIASVWFDSVRFLTWAVGAWTPSSTLFFFGLLFLLIVCLNYAVRLSGMSAQVRLLAQEVALLREYGTRLIADVVTGKLDVRGVELPEVDEVEAQEDWDQDADVEAEEIVDVEEAVDADE